MARYNVAIRYTYTVYGSAWEEVEASDEAEALRIVRDKHEALVAAVPGSWNFDLDNDDVSEVQQ